MTSPLYRIVRTLIVLGPAVLAGCASIDFDAYKDASYAPLNTADTYLGRSVEPLLPEGRSDESGFYIIDDGVEALAVRIAAAARSERSIDVQTYLIKNETTSQLFVGALLRAADRGVRVRLLLDDVFTGGEIDEALAVMHSHPNFEVRIFNPFAQRRVRALDGLTNFGRVNRRMHNKTFTVDNQITIIGGRNYADEYFAAHEQLDFLDTDVLAIGPIVPEVSDMFDDYWNHRLAVPVSQFIDVRGDLEETEKQLRKTIAATAGDLAGTVYGEALVQRVFEKEDILDESIWARYDLIYDAPDKIEAKRDGRVAAAEVTVVQPLIEAFEAAEREVLVVSPYFVPRASGVEFLSGIVDKGVDVEVITNSLAANNHWVVHSGYAPYRKRLLRAGVELYEVRPDVPFEDDVPEEFQSETTTLHSKLTIFDRSRIFIGSFNYDPRSANINTEMGVIIESPELIEKYARGMTRAVSDFAWQLSLDDSDGLVWTGTVGGEPDIHTSEPAPFSKRFLSGLVSIFPIKGQL